MPQNDYERLLTPREAAAQAERLIRDEAVALGAAQIATEAAVLSEPLFAPEGHPAHARHAAADTAFHEARMGLRAATRERTAFVKKYGNVLGETAVVPEAEVAK